MQFITRLKTLAQQETSAERRQRMLPGILYGLTVASSYAIVSGLVNQLSFPDLPIGIDWHTHLMIWLFFSLWLGVGGGFVNWFTQNEEGFIPSLLIMILTALGAGTATLEGNLPVRFGKIGLLILPVIAVSLAATILLRWFGMHHAELLQKEKLVRTRGILILIALALVLGGGTGFALTRWADSTLSGVKEIDRRLQAAAANPDSANELFPLNDLPDLASHLGVSYALLGKPYGQLVDAIQVTARFEDGYQFTCVVLLILPSGSPYLRACAEGDRVSLPAQ